MNHIKFEEAFAKEMTIPNMYASEARHRMNEMEETVLRDVLTDSGVNVDSPAEILRRVKFVHTLGYSMSYTVLIDDAFVGILTKKIENFTTLIVEFRPL